MSDRQYPPGGVLFNNQKKKSDNSPDFTGSLEVDADLLTELQAQLQANPRAKLDLAAWRKMSNGKEFLSLRLKRPYNGAMTQPQGNGGQYANSTQQGSQQRSAPPPIDDEIPF